MFPERSTYEKRKSILSLGRKGKVTRYPDGGNPHTGGPQVISNCMNCELLCIKTQSSKKLAIKWTTRSDSFIEQNISDGAGSGSA